MFERIGSLNRQLVCCQNEKPTHEAGFFCPLPRSALVRERKMVSQEPYITGTGFVAIRRTAGSFSLMSRQQD